MQWAVMESEGKMRERMLATAKAYAVNALGAVSMSERRLARKIGERLARDFGHEEEGLDQDMAASVVHEVVALCRTYSMVDDARLAGSHASSDIRRGRSRGRSMLGMRGRGMAEEQVSAATADYDEMAAALVFARRKRAGPFAPDPWPDDRRRKAMAAFMRNGFGFDIWKRICAMDPEEAGEILDRR